MADVESLLTDNEQRALELHEDLPRARAINAWLTFAALQNFEADRLLRGVEEIRSMPLEQLKQIRKDLAASTRLLDAMPSTRHDIEDVSIPEPLKLVSPSELGAASIENTVKPEDEIAARSIIDEDLEAPDAPITETHPSTELSAVAASNTEEPGGLVETAGFSSGSGMKWAQDLLKLDSLDGFSKDDIVTLIIDRTQPKPAFVKGNKDHPIDLAKRIRQRIEGFDYAAIAATEEDVTRGAVQIWFSVNIIKPLKRLDSEIMIERQSPPEPEPEPIRVPTPLHIKPQRIEYTKPVDVDLTTFANRWASEIGFTPDEAESLIDVLNPDYTLELNGVHRQVRHRFRIYMRDNLPELESSDLDLTTNEIARLNQLLGRSKTDDDYKYDLLPKSAREVSTERGYLVPQKRDELLLALEKVAVYLNKDQDITKETTNEPEELLIRAGLSQVEASALLAYLTHNEDGAATEKTAETQSALRRVQQLLIQNKAKISDTEVAAPGLSMLSSVALGSKSLDDVYYKLHSINPKITRQEVIERLNIGLIQLVA